MCFVCFFIFPALTGGGGGVDYCDYGHSPPCPLFQAVMVPVDKPIVKLIPYANPEKIAG